jgi:hypothetical protein
MLKKKLSYQDYAKGVLFLTPDEQMKLMELILSTLRPVIQKTKPGHSIMELEGLGADIWKNMDAQEYVRRERESWD